MVRNILIFVGLFLSINAFGQYPRIILKQIEKATDQGQFIVSDADSNGVWSSSLQITVDSFLTLYGDTIQSGVNYEKIQDTIAFMLEAGLGIQMTYNDADGEFLIESLSIQDSIYNGTGSTIVKGTPLYAVGVQGNYWSVAPADASDLNKLPAVVIAGEDIAAGATGLGLLKGHIKQVSTVGFADGDEVYVGVGGGYTNVKPKGESNYVQRLGTVIKGNSATGSGIINLGEVQSTSNLNPRNIFIGASDSTVTTTDIDTLISDSLAYYVSLAGVQTITGAKTFTSDVNVDGRIDLNDGGYNVFIGDLSGINEDGTINYNVGIGYNALNQNQGGQNSVVIGAFANDADTISYDVVAIGYQALSSNNGSNNTVIGTYAGANNTSGFQNTVLGHLAMRYNTTGYTNVVIGSGAANNQSDNSTLTDLRNSVFIGNSVKSDGNAQSNQIVIGANAVGDGSNTIRLGDGNVTQLGAGNYKLDIDQTVDATTDNYVLTYDLGDGQISLEQGGIDTTQAVGLISDSLVNYLAISDYIVDSTRINVTGDTAYYYQNGVLIGSKALAGGGGGGYWTQNGTDLFYNTGNVGINQSTPSAKLDVVGDVEIDGKLDLNSGTRNVSIGTQVLGSNTGTDNTGVGYIALQNNSTAIMNTAIGSYSLNQTTTGIGNTSVGFQSSRYNTTGGNNVSVGYQSSRDNTTGSYNTSVGESALLEQDGGDNNVGVGYRAGAYTSTGTQATNINNNTYIGTLTTATNTSTNETVIGYDADGNGSNTVTLGNSSVTELHSGNYEFDVDQTVGVTEDNYVLTYDNADGQISLEPGGTSYNNISETADTVYIAKYLDVDTSTLYVDATTNRVGIGTSTPSYKLNIYENADVDVTATVTNASSAGTARASLRTDSDIASFLVQTHSSGHTGTSFGLNRANMARFVVVNASSFLFGTFDATPIYYGTNAAIRMTIDGSGNVGIGTSTPSAKFQVDADSAIAVDATNNILHVNGTYVPSLAPSARGKIEINGLENNVAFRYKGGFINETNDYGSLSKSTNLNNKRIQYIFYDRNNIQTGKFGVDVVGTNDDDFQIVAGSGSTPQFHIEANGNVGIGTTSPSYKTVIDTDNGIINIGDFSAGRTGIIINLDDDSSTAGIFGVGKTGNTFTNFNFSPQGKLQWGTGTAIWDVNLYRNAANQLKTDDAFICLSLTQTSDMRSKENVNYFYNGLEIVKKLNPVKYNYIGVEGEYIGFIAQDVKEVLPSAVKGDEAKEMLGINYSQFHAITVNAIQEQQAIIETQEQKITDLETTIQALITRIENLENK